MHAASAERRTTPRLGLSYPIRLLREGETGGGLLGHTVTKDLSARGAYFSTFDGRTYRVGQRVNVVISVPHRLSSGGKEILLDLRGSAAVVRLEGPAAHRTYGENGLALTGVAVAFDEPLQFRYGWV
jgi:hypothetical protein